MLWPKLIENYSQTVRDVTRISNTRFFCKSLKLVLDSDAVYRLIEDPLLRSQLFEAFP